jgi:hypothetical protein
MVARAVGVDLHGDTPERVEPPELAGDEEGAHGEAVPRSSMSAPAERTRNGRASSCTTSSTASPRIVTSRALSRFEAVLGSGVTGTIDRSVANYMKEHGYDLREYAERN